MWAAYFLAFSTGFLSLGLEVLWVRLFSFVNHSLPQSFAFVLMFYLIGIAFGAQIGKKFCEKFSNLWLVSGIVLLLSSIVDVLGPKIFADAMGCSLTILLGGYLILITALMKAILFPIAHHLGANQNSKKIGSAISKVYVANIFGATLGPIVVGILMLGMLSSQQCFILLGTAAFFLGAFCLVSVMQPVLLGTGIAVIFLMQVIALNRNPNALMMQIAAASFNHKILHLVENRHGIVTIYQGKNSDIVFGGNVYDGLTNLDPKVNSNNINRLLILSTLQKKPEHVLMIGLSIGTWLKLVTSFPGIKQIDVVEINPGYLPVIKNYPAQQNALKDPRVKIYFDDGRRWLKSHPEKKYDLIVMNTTFYWRVYSANLLSEDFLALIKKHMNSNAVLAYNSTSSPDVLKTAAQQFSYAFLYMNFVIAADFDWRKMLHDPAAKKILSSLQMDGKPLFRTQEEQLIDKFLNLPLVSLSNLESTSRRKIAVITDKNLITEYKYGKNLF